MLCLFLCRSCFLFLSTLSLRRATITDGSICLDSRISIHALLAESDFKILVESQRYNNFYPRSPCGERLMYALKLADTMLFLSTLSLRRATFFIISARHVWLISIHALLAESDRQIQKIENDEVHFYPRSPCGERRCEMISIERCSFISIHALLAESDRFQAADISARRISIHALLAESDPGSVRGISSKTAISIHALLAESDRSYFLGSSVPVKFLSTLSLRRATRGG